MDEWAKTNRDYHDTVVSNYEEIIRPDWLPDSVFRFRDVFRPHLRALPPDARILEIGPGPGDFCRELLGLGFRNIDAVDISPEMASKVKRELVDVHCVTGDATILPYAGDAFDFINVK